MTTLVFIDAVTAGATARRVLASLAFVAAVPLVAGAQGPAGLLPAEGPAHVAPRSGFSLFGNADFAGTGMRVSGGMSWGVTNLGPCSGSFGVPFQENGCGRYVGVSSTFEVVFSAGAGPGDFRKIRAVHPGVNGHLGPQGYTHLDHHVRHGIGSQDWGPGDNTLGSLFSGVTSTSDGSCRDNTNAGNNFMNTGFTLLAGSDCPETWAGSFNGPRVLNDSAFIRLKQAQGPDFTFDYWKVNPADRSTTPLGNFSTYGVISDHFAEAIASYGSVTPLGGVGKPARNGFPLGLDIHFEAFTFNRPQLANVVFYQALVINNSEDVYGVGIDYDSLYMGVQNGMLHGGQNPSMYSEPHRNAFISVPNAVNPGCNGGTPGVPNNCAAQPGGFAGANNHGYAMIVLKSPIGDTRNKLLSRPGAFYDPTSRFADDTITFNHHHGCRYGASCFSSTFEINDRRGFGMISSTEPNVLDGRDPAGLTALTQWDTFRPKAHPVQPNAVFNRYVPGTDADPKWSYENKPFRELAPNKPDTIFFDSCEGQGFIERNGQLLPSCAVTYSDTMPGKQINRGGANVGNLQTAGPFPLKAGDTTSFVFAWLAEGDSAAFEAMINSAIDAYLNFYLGPDAPPVPRIVSVEVSSEEEQFPLDGNAFVRLVFTDEPETFVDPFFERYASDLRNSTDPFFARLRALNPGLADEVEEIAENNFSELWIFKSCDNGTTFTSDADCAGDPTTGPRGTLGLGWQPYAIIEAGADGSISNTYTDANVTPGITYLYSLVTRSRGLTVAINDVNPATCPPPYTPGSPGCTPFQTILTIADTAGSTIQTSGPTTANVYVPISLPAGGAPGAAVTTVVRGNSTLPITVLVGANAPGGDYRLVFGNQFIISEETNSATGATTTAVRVQTVIPSAVRNGVTISNFVERETVLFGPGPIDVTGFTFTPRDTTIGSRLIRIDTVSALGFALAQGNRPLFVSTELDEANMPEGFANREGFPGFRFGFSQDSSNILQNERIVRTNGDTVPLIIQNANALQYRQESSTRVNGRGTYEFRFADDAFGPGVPFNPQGTSETIQPSVTASLAAREVAVTGATSDGIKAVLTGAGLGAYADALAPIRFPFTVVSQTGNPVILAARPRTSTGATNTLLIGNGADTVRVNVDSLDWLPGDPFVILEVVEADAVDANGAVLIDDETGQPITTLDTIVAFAPAVLGCNTPRERCNPARFPGAGGTGYLPFQDGWKLVINYPFPFTAESEIALRIEGQNRTVAFTRSDLSKIRVVPNPYVVQSFYDEVGGARLGEPRLLFTGVPTRGSIRIYSVSGQFLQELEWEPSDLEGGSGDLPWNLRTREGTLVAGGLYIYVLTAHDADGKKVNARGKFVIIR